jgi:hypothetical protein
MDSENNYNIKNYIRELVNNCNLCNDIDRSGALCINSKEIGLNYNDIPKVPIKVLFIAESPPPRGKGFFYDLSSINTKFRDKLFCLINEAGLGRVKKLEGFSKLAYYLADAINCRWDKSIKNYISRRIVKNCSAHLVEQIKLFKPRFIVAMGTTAKYSLKLKNVKEIMGEFEIHADHIIEMSFPLTAVNETDRERISKLKKIQKIN